MICGKYCKHPIFLISQKPKELSMSINSFKAGKSFQHALYICCYQAPYEKAFFFCFSGAQSAEEIRPGGSWQLSSKDLYCTFDIEKK